MNFKQFIALMIYKPTFWLASEVLDEIPNLRRDYINSLVPVSERLYPDDPNMRPQTIVHHLKRYWFATQFINKHERCLDYACGSGYGTQILQEHSNRVCVGYDPDEQALEYAINHFTKPAYFFKDDYFPYKFGLITFFEAIEHMDEKQGKKTLKELKELLTKKGTLIMSIPRDRDENRNGFHKSQWKQKSLEKYLKRLFSDVETYGQDWDTGEIGAVDPDFYIYVCKV